MREPHFNGPEYVAERDHDRLLTQHERIRDLMVDGYWRTLAEIELVLGYPQASISAQLRHLRKPRFGGFIVNRRKRSCVGVYEYQLQKPGPDGQIEMSFNEGERE